MKNILTIPSILKDCKKRFANKPAMDLDNGKKITYTDLLWDISRTMQQMKRNGISKASKVAVFAEANPQSIVTFLAITAMGAVAVLLKYDLTEEEVTEILKKENPEAVFIRRDKLNLISSVNTTTIFEMADNSILKTDPSLRLGTVGGITGTDIAAIVYQKDSENRITSTAYTQKQFAAAVKETKKRSSSKPTFDTLLAYCKTCILPMLKGNCVHSAV
ncbi:MAG: acyl--CoA ligase [Spirochaetaceae bacterium]|nr:acyl--CoA ligase [Spirochaetaceae bacterium]